MNIFFFRQPHRPQRRQQAFWRSALWHATEFVALVLALVLALCGGLAWQLAQGPVSLEFLRDDAQKAISRIFTGDSATIGTLQASWSGQEHALVIAAHDVQVLDANGAVLMRSPQIDVGLSALGLLRGKVMIQRLVATGGEFSIVRGANGVVGGGLGKPGQIKLPKPAPPAKTAQTHGSFANILGHLNTLAMRGAVLHFVDRRTGINWVAPRANVRFQRSQGRIIASASGEILSSAGTATLSLSAFSRPDFSHMSAEIILGNAVPAVLLPVRDGPLRWLGALDAPVQAQISFSTDDAGLLRSADGLISLDKGLYHVGNRAFAVHSGQLVLAFDPVEGAVQIASATLQSDILEGSLKGRIAGLDPARLVVGKSLDFELAFDALKVSPPGIYAHPLEIKSLDLKGAYKPGQATINFRHIGLHYAGLKLHGSADLELPAKDRSGADMLLKLDAHSQGEVSPADILALWPPKLAKGGRDWIANNVIAARLHDFALKVRLPQRVIGASRLDNNMLNLAFKFDQARSHFVHVMTPVGEAQGTGVLQGNRFDLRLERAMLKDTELTDGFVHIPRLSPKGVTGHFGGHARGSLDDVVNLLDEPPLGFVSRYGLSPETISGKGEMDFAISRPMRVSVPARQITFDAKGAYRDIRVKALIAGQEISEVAATFSANQDGLTVNGKGSMGPVPGEFVWQERFFPQNQPRTVLDIDAVADSQLFDRLGIPTRLFLDGPVGLHMHSSGEGLNIATADFTANLDAARLMSPGAEWEKPAGQKGSAGFTVLRRKDGGYDIQNMQARTKGFVLDGDFSLTPAGGLQVAHIRRAQMQGLFDLSADLERADNGGFILDGKADSLDARGFVRGLSQGQSTSLGVALEGHVVFERALVSDAMTVKDGVLDFRKSEQAIDQLDFHAKTPNGNAAFSIAPGEDGRRHIAGRTDDAGLVIEALFGLASVHGGVLTVKGVLGDGAKQNTRLDLGMQNFKLSNVPAMARILSLGSLTGIANTMNGEGLGFRNLVAPLEFDSGTVVIGRARATGPALGGTMSGTVDMAGKTMNLKGSLAPAYTLNSALGKIPLIGDVLVSRKGEGVFGLSYRVHGPFNALEVFVNPLSALTPGFLRRIFEGESRTPAPAKPEPDKTKSAPAPEQKAKPDTKPAGPGEKQPPKSPAEPAPAQGQGQD